MASLKSLLFLFAILSLVLSVTAKDEGFMVLRGVPEHHIESIPETQSKDLISHINNLPPVHDNVERDGYPHTNLFEGPSANIIVAVDSLTTDMAKDFVEFFNKEGDSEIVLTKKDSSEDSLASLTSMMTGKEPTEHGILGESWKVSSISSVRAFTEYGNCKTAKISDEIAVLSQGASKVVAVSGSKFMASALGVHTEIASANPEWNFDTLYFVKGRGLVDLYTGAVVYSENFIRKDALLYLSDVKTKEGLLLISEMIAIDKIPERLSRMQDVETDIADLISVGISSIGNMVRLHGENSDQARLALFLLDRCLNEMVNTINEMYQGKVTVQLVGVPDAETVHSKSQSKAAADTDDDADMDDDSDDDTYTADQVYTLNAFFWVSILLIVIAIGCVYTLTSMDMLYTSVVYRTVDGPRPIQDVQ